MKGAGKPPKARPTVYGPVAPLVIAPRQTGTGAVRDQAMAHSVKSTTSKVNGSTGNEVTTSTVATAKIDEPAKPAEEPKIGSYCLKILSLFYSLLSW